MEILPNKPVFSYIVIFVLCEFFKFKHQVPPPN